MNGIDQASMFQPECQDLFLERVQKVHQLVYSCINADIPVVEQAIAYLLTSEAAQIRQSFPLRVADALAGSTAQQYRLAAAVELIHAALDFHTRIDSDSGEPAQFADAAGILLGDLLYTGAFRLIVGLNDLSVMRILSRACTVIVEAEVEQRAWGTAPGGAALDRIDIALRPRAALFEATARCLAILARAGSPETERLARYGAHLGTAYQLWNEPRFHHLREPALGQVQNEVDQAIAVLAPFADTAFKAGLIDYAAYVGERGKQSGQS